MAAVAPPSSTAATSGRHLSELRSASDPRAAARGPRPAAAAGIRSGRIASVLATVGDEATSALLPGFMVGTLASAPIALGVVEGVANGAAGIARLGGGPLGEDRRRRRLVSVGGYAGAAVLSGVIGITSNALQAGALRAGAWTARGLRAPQRYAAVPERVGAERYGRAFGLERGLEHLASVGGPVLAFGLLAVVEIRLALMLAVVPGLLAVIITLRTGRGRSDAQPSSGAPRVQLQTRAVFRGPLGRLMVGISLFELSNFAATLLILRSAKLLEHGEPALGATRTAVLLYLLYRVGAGVCCPLAGRAVDGMGPAVVMATGSLTLLGAYAGFALFEGTATQLAVCFLAAGAAIGAVEAAEHAGVAQLAPAAVRWSAFGMLAALQSFGKLVASIVAATLWTLLGPEYGLLFAAPLMVASAVVLALGSRRAA